MTRGSIFLTLPLLVDVHRAVSFIVHDVVVRFPAIPQDWRGDVSLRVVEKL